MNSLESTTEHEIDVNSAPAESAPEPTTEDLADKSLKIVAELGDQTDYEQERFDQTAKASGDRSYYDEDRKEAREARWDKIYQKMQENTAEALGGYDPIAEADDRIHWERIQATTHVRAEHYEKSNPGFLQRVQQAVDLHGPLARHAAKVIGQSNLVSELSDWIAHNPDSISQLNRASAHDVALWVARMEGLHHGAAHAAPAQRPIASKKFSTAPKPVSTVSGKAHQGGRTPDQMGYDEFKVWRMGQMKAARR